MSELKTLTDAHCHVAVLPTKENGCIMSDKMRNGFVARSVARAHGLPLDDAETANRLYLEQMAAKLEASKTVARAVLLAMDGVYGADGKLDEKRTEFLISNDFMLGVARNNDRFLAGVSVNPNRRDALDELRRCAEAGAALVKLLPNAQVFDPADPKHRPFWEECAKLKLPVLSHIGFEFSLLGQDQSVGNPERLIPALEAGATVIAAHGCSRGLVFGEPHFQTMLGMIRRFKRFYVDSSALTLPNRFGMLLKLRGAEEVLPRLIFGTDYPLPVWAFPALAAGPSAWLRARAATNPFDRQLEVQKALGLEPRVDFASLLRN